MPANLLISPSPPHRKHRGRWKWLLLPLVGALIVSSGLIVANLLRSDTTLYVQVVGQPQAVIDLNQTLPLSPYLSGSTVFPANNTLSRDGTGPGFMSYSPSIVSGLRSARVSLLRFPGGDWG